MMGEVPFDDIFSLTDKWNFSDEACTLREYLGLTAKEEDVWISDSDDALEELMEKEKKYQGSFPGSGRNALYRRKDFFCRQLSGDRRGSCDRTPYRDLHRPPSCQCDHAGKRTWFLRKKGCFVISFNGGEIYDMYRKKEYFQKTACNAARSPHF